MSFSSGFALGDLWFQASDRADDGVLDAFFPAYDKAFILPNEKEGMEGFQSCLALNHGAMHETLSTRHGRFRELVLVAREKRAGTVVGGANFLVLLPQPTSLHEATWTINLNYLFVDPALRGRSLSRKVLSACRRLAGQLVHTEPRTGAIPEGLVFLELNDPFRLTPEQYRIDSEHAGIDQLARLAYWSHMGAKVLDFTYVQPALSAQQGDDDTLAMAVIGSTDGQLSAGLVRNHLERFFAISVLKGSPLDKSPSVRRQMTELGQLTERGKPVRLLDLADPESRLQALLNRADDRPVSLVEALMRMCHDDRGS